MATGSTPDYIEPPDFNTESERIETQNLSNLEKEIIKDPSVPVEINFSMEENVPEIIATKGNKIFVYKHPIHLYYHHPEYRRVRGMEHIMGIGLKLVRDVHGKSKVELTLNGLPLIEGIETVENYRHGFQQQALNYLMMRG